LQQLNHNIKEKMQCSFLLTMCSHWQFPMVVGNGAEVVLSPDSVRGLRSQALSVVVVMADLVIEV